jgi:excisionase family DNA binding protein
MNELYTTHDVSKLLQVDASTVSKWIDKGILTAYRTPGGHRRVRAQELRSFLIAHQMPVPEELGSAQVSLLVVDDEKAVIDAIRRAFRPYQNQVQLTTTTSGIEALLLLSELKPHGVLLDLNMPDLDGYEVCRAIRSRKSLEGVRILTMTARHTQDVVAQSVKAGAVTCLAKPVDVAEVLQIFRIPLAMSQKA